MTKFNQKCLQFAFSIVVLLLFIIVLFSCPITLLNYPEGLVYFIYNNNNNCVFENTVNVTPCSGTQLVNVPTYWKIFS